MSLTQDPYTVYLDPVPDAIYVTPEDSTTPYPTSTAYPTATPYPTHTPYPTPTLIPTPYPTLTLYPTPTTTPTKTLADTPASCPSASEVSLVNFSFSPASVSATGAPIITLIYNLQTTGAGINYIDTTFVSPSGNYYASIAYEDLMISWGNPTSGSPQDGVFELTWDMSWIDLKANQGVWAVSEIRIVDQKSNVSEESPFNTLFTQNCLRDKGYNIQLAVNP